MNLRPLRALRDLDRKLDEMHAADRAAEEWARFELARSASSFSRRTQRVVDDTVSLSATLMRAGEVEEANRLLAEAEREVRTEEAALIETVNEVKAAGEIRKRRLSRLRVAKAFATAMLSTSMFVTSALGVVLARSVIEDEPTVAGTGSERDGVDDVISRSERAQHVELMPGIAVKMTKAELKQFVRLTNVGDKDGLRRFLAERLPTGLVEQVEAVLLSMTTTASGAVEEVTDEVAKVTTATRSTQGSKPSSSEPAQEGSPSPEPAEEDPGASPEPDPEPSPTPDRDDDQDGKDGGGEYNTPLIEDWPL